MSDIYVGLDIGTSNVRVIIGEFDQDNVFQITGVGVAHSTGLRSGVIVNIEATMKSVNEAIEKAEIMAGVEISSCFAGIGGSQVDSLNSKGLVAVSGRNKSTKEINQNDVDRVIEAARAIAIPLDRQIIHVVPQLYTVDGVQKTKDPLDMIGVRLEVEVHIITAKTTTMETLFKCISRSGYKMDGLMLKTLASAQAVFTPEEKELGSILIDLGGGSTDVIVVADGAPICTDSVPYGGIMVTNDISIVRGIPNETAEKIKISDGCCWEHLLSEYEGVVIPGIGGRAPEEISRKDICQIIQPRVEEILVMIRDRVFSKIGDRTLSGNIVLVGGGALMAGIIELTTEVFSYHNVRIGIPSKQGGTIDEYRTCDFATATGLVLSCAQQNKSSSGKSLDKETGAKNKSFKETLKNFFREFF
ncbi:MAG: cell division protein FtsA [Treponemataceae bacterium]